MRNKYQKVDNLLRELWYKADRHLYDAHFVGNLTFLKLEQVSLLGNRLLNMANEQ